VWEWFKRWREWLLAWWDEAISHLGGFTILAVVLPIMFVCWLGDFMLRRFPCGLLYRYYIKRKCILGACFSVDPPGGEEAFWFESSCQGIVVNLSRLHENLVGMRLRGVNENRCFYVQYLYWINLNRLTSLSTRELEPWRNDCQSPTPTDLDERGQTLSEVNGKLAIIRRLPGH